MALLIIFLEAQEVFSLCLFKATFAICAFCCSFKLFSPLFIFRAKLAYAIEAGIFLHRHYLPPLSDCASEVGPWGTIAACWYSSKSRLR